MPPLNQSRPSFNPSRLDLARRRRGYTKAALAEELGLSTRILTAYYAGEKEPEEETVRRIAETLRFPTEFFYGRTLEEPPIEASSFRAYTSMTAKQRDQALASGTIALALGDWIDEHFTLPEPNIPMYPGIDPEMAAMAVREEWGLGVQPIKNMIHLLEKHGVHVFSLTEDCIELDAFSFWRRGRPYMFLNTMKSAERSRMDAAHELGHLVLHAKQGIHTREGEREANLFGASFLMPRDSVLAEVPRGAMLEQIIQLKRRWNASAANLAHRLYELGLLTKWQYHSLFVELARNNYRIQEPNGSQGETSQVLAKVFAQLRQDGMTMSQVAQKLDVGPEELNKVLFGLILTPIVGSGMPDRNRPMAQPQLRLV